MFSNLASEPIEHGGKKDKSEEGCGEFLVTGGYPSVGFDPAEEVFDLMAAVIIAAMEADWLPPATFGRNAATGALPGKPETKDVGIESLVGDNPPTPCIWQHRPDRVLVVLRARGEAECHRPTMLINQRRELGVETALGPSHRLRLLAASGIGAVLVQLDVGAIQMPAGAELALYRILQEALRNVEQHAHARHVRVRLTQQSEIVQLSIKDDGVGFAPDRQPAKQKRKNHVGLLGMRERAISVGGSLSIKSVLRVGTKIEVRMPCHLSPGLSTSAVDHS